MRERKSGAPRARKGETLAEVLVALLVVALATLLLASMVTASAGINFNIRQKDERFYGALSQVEAMEGSPATPPVGSSHTVAITDSTGTVVDEPEVDVYTSENLTVYKEAAP